MLSFVVNVYACHVKKVRLHNKMIKHCLLKPLQMCASINDQKVSTFLYLYL